MAEDTSYLQELYSGASSAVSSITGSSSETTTSTTTTTTTNDSPTWGAIAPDWIQDLSSVADVLQAFGKSPAGFILGAVLSELLGGIETVVTASLNAITFLFVGSGPGTTGMLGLADIPLLAVEVLIDATSGLGQTVLELIGTLIGSVGDFAANAGPAAPIVVAGSIGVAAIVGAWTLRTLIDVIADAIPGLQGIIK